VSEFSFAAGQKNAGQNDNETLFSVSVGSATVPTGIGRHGGLPYGPKHLKSHTRWQKTESWRH